MNLESIKLMERTGDGEELLLTFDNGRQKVARVSGLALMIGGAANPQRAYAVAMAMREVAAEDGVNWTGFVDKQAGAISEMVQALQ